MLHANLISGISSAYGGVLSALEIIYTLTPIDTPLHGDENLLDGQRLVAGHKYKEQESVHAIYERKKVRIALEERELVL